jgi:hypothetical protein
MNRGACALIVTSASPSSTRTSSASTLSGSGSRGGGSGSAEGSGFRGSGGRRITVFTVAPQVFVTAASTASTATASLLAALQKKRAKKDSARFDEVVMSAENHVATDGISSMQSQQQHRSTQVEGKLKISLHVTAPFEVMTPVTCILHFVNFGAFLCCTRLQVTFSSFFRNVTYNIIPTCIAVHYKSLQLDVPLYMRMCVCVCYCACARLSL